MHKPSLLILSTSGGAGHHRAAEALLEAAKNSPVPLRAAHYDCLDFTSKAFKRLYGESYLAMVNSIPEIWGYLYSHTEKKTYSKKRASENLRPFQLQPISQKPSARIDPDLILCTHFLP